MLTDKPSTMARVKSDDCTLSQGAPIVAKGEHDLDDSNSEILMLYEAQDGTDHIRSSTIPTRERHYAGEKKQQNLDCSSTHYGSEIRWTPLKLRSCSFLGC